MAGVRVQVVFATPTHQYRDQVDAEQGITLGEVIRRSTLAWTLDDSAQVGVFGRLRSLSDTAVDGDRIEIYRPLVADPKASRRRRAASQRRIKGGACPG